MIIGYNPSDHPIYGHSLAKSESAIKAASTSLRILEDINFSETTVWSGANLASLFHLSSDVLLDHTCQYLCIHSQDSGESTLGNLYAQGDEKQGDV